MASQKALPFEDWPQQDRDAYNAYERALNRDAAASSRTEAFDDLFDNLSKASPEEIDALLEARDSDATSDAANGAYYMHKIVAGSTEAQIKRAHGRWLAFLEDHDPTALLKPSAQRITNARLDAFIEALKSTRGPAGIALLLVQMRMMLVRLVPNEPFAHLRKTATFWALKRIDEPMRRDLLLANEIFELGITMMSKAEKEMRRSSTRPGKRLDRRIRNKYRNGLVLAIFAVCPLRRSNLAGLELDDFDENRERQRSAAGERGGRSAGNGSSVASRLIIKERGKSFAILVAADAVKNDLDLDFSLPQDLTPFLKVYLTSIRPEYPAADTHRRLFCSSRRAAPLTSPSFNILTKTVTLREKRIAQTPRDIRRGAVTYWAIHDPLNLERCRHLLGHKRGSRTLNRAYNMVSSTRHAARNLYRDVMAFLAA